MKPDKTLTRARGKLLGRARRRATGLVEVPGPLSRGTTTEIRNLTCNVLERERRRDPDARLLSISLFAEGLAIETSSARLAQNIAGAIRRSHRADVERVMDDEGRRRILTCRLRTKD
jgi:hypothetical protein